MTNEKIALIDLGGTNIDVYEYLTSKRLCNLVKQLSTKNIDVNKWINSLDKDIGKQGFDQIILGLPGDVRPENKEVYWKRLVWQIYASRYSTF